MSTEILESSFGLYKPTGKASIRKSGFTSLLACLPALLKPTTPEGVRAAFARTSAEDVVAWTQEHFPSTVTSRRHAAYAEHQSAVRRATSRRQPHFEELTGPALGGVTRRRPVGRITLGFIGLGWKGFEGCWGSLLQGFIHETRHASSGSLRRGPPFPRPGQGVRDKYYGNRDCAVYQDSATSSPGRIWMR